MAIAITRIQILHGSNVLPSFIASELDEPDRRNLVRRLITMLKALVVGIRRGRLVIHVDSATDATKATLDGTYTAVAPANDTVTVAGVLFTAKASPSGEAEFAIGASATASATNLAAKIAAHSSLKGIVTASSPSAGVVRVTSELEGRIGNLFTVAESSSDFTWAGGATKLAGGSGTEVMAVRTVDFGGVA
jgi:hypothetical protein